MEKLYLDDTIAAISTPLGKSGIGIVRLSGKKALSIADKIFIGSNGKRPSRLSSHRLYYGWIKNGKERIDEVLLNVMRAPRTYTKEDIVEINCHSGIAVLRKILELVLGLGARLAGRGEFTKRAYLAGRIDLTQAEAILDIINSQTPQALNAALGQLEGRLSEKIGNLRRSLLEISTQLEASIDFADQDIEPKSLEKILKKAEKASYQIKELLDSADKGTILREGISCVICGRPNVGKSSLLNALLKKDRAIVTPLPGTTRDVLEETVDISGIPLRLIDTAGIVKASNLAEAEAVKRSRKALKEADLILLVLDASRKLEAEDLKISRYISERCAFVVLNKQDLPQKIGADELSRVSGGRKVIKVSALRGRGLKSLQREIAAYLWRGEAPSGDELLITNIRHRQALKKAHLSLRRVNKAIKMSQGTEIVALYIKEAQSFLGEIIGKIRCEDILERIFSQFCIGK